MLIQRSAIRSLQHVLNNPDFFEMPISSQFRFMVVSNIKILDVEITKLIAFDEGLVLPDSFPEYEAKRKEALTRFNVSKASDYDSLPPEEASKFESEIKALNTQYAKEISAINTIRIAKEAFYKESIDIPLKTVKLECVPTISTKSGDNHWAIWNTLMPLVVD